MAVSGGEVPALGRERGLVGLVCVGGVSCGAWRDVVVVGRRGGGGAEDARGSRRGLGDEGGDDGEVVTDVDDPARELYALSLVSVFECAYLVANGIEGDVVARAGVRFVERVHGWWRGGEGEGELISAREIRLSGESRNDLG